MNSRQHEAEPGAKGEDRGWERAETKPHQHLTNGEAVTGEGDRAIVAGLAEGSIGRALALAEAGGIDLYRDLSETLLVLPRLDAAGASFVSVTQAFNTTTSMGRLTLNVLLCAFNLIPLPPLDGASVIGLFIPESLAFRVRELSRTPMFQMLGLLIAWRIFPVIVGPLFGLILKAVHPSLGYY